MQSKKNKRNIKFALGSYQNNEVVNSRLNISRNSDADLLQKDLIDIQLWMHKWLLTLNIEKCKFVSYGHYLDFKNDYYL